MQCRGTGHLLRTANRVLIASSLGTFLPTGRLLLPPSSTSNQLHLMSRLQGTHWEPLEVGRGQRVRLFSSFSVFFASLSLFSLSYRFGLGLGLSLCQPKLYKLYNHKTERNGIKKRHSAVVSFLPAPFDPSFLPSSSRLVRAPSSPRVIDETSSSHAEVGSAFPLRLPGNSEIPEVLLVPCNICI